MISTIDRSTPFVNRLVTSETVTANGGTAIIPLPSDATLYNIVIVNAFLATSAGGVVRFYYDNAALIGYISQSGIYVINNGGASGRIYVDYTITGT